MPIVSGNRLHRFMSEPQWTSAQRQEAERHCAQVEADLEAALYGAVISPREVDEDAVINADGSVDTTLPVFALISIAGVVAVDGVPPAGYQLAGRHLARSSTLPSPGAWFAAGLGEPETVRVHYMGGWGDDPALEGAILAKAAIRMGGRHADTKVVTGLTAQSAPAPPPAHWTDDDLRSLNRFRRWR